MDRFAEHTRWASCVDTWRDELPSQHDGIDLVCLLRLSGRILSSKSRCYSYYIMEWFMQALLVRVLLAASSHVTLLYRHDSCTAASFSGTGKEVSSYLCAPPLQPWSVRPCFLSFFLFTGAAPYVTGLSTLVLAEARHGVHSINNQLGYLCLQVGLTLAYTLLVVHRLLALQRKMRAISRREDLSPHENAVVTIIESAALYAPVGVIVVISFAMHSDVTNLVYLSVSHVQVSATPSPVRRESVFLSFLVVRLDLI